jgi:CRP-like cAMP-binding protein
MHDALALIRRLDSIVDLSEADRADLSALPIQIVSVDADQDIMREGDRPNRCCLLVEGLAAIYKMAAESRRQISSFILSGEIPDLSTLHLETADSSIVTLTPSVLGYISHDALRRLCENNARVAAALWRMTLIDAAIFCEWTTNLGQRDATSRMAHLFCELFVRSRAVGLGNEHSISLPLTQNELADATGMSNVHANRTLQELRARQLISFDGTRLIVLDWPKLCRTGDFREGYLHLRQSPIAVQA